MTEADILATTYDDKVTVYRPFKDTKPNGESIFRSGPNGKKIYEGMTCALSTHTGGKLHPEDKISIFVLINDLPKFMLANPEILCCLLNAQCILFPKWDLTHFSHDC